VAELPEPMTPPDCNLRGLPFMPLEVQRLLDSDLFILSTGDEFKAAVALWCKSWGQVPGGSLPDNERLLEGLSGSKSWKRVREIALRGWVKCSDGRLYHAVVAENAVKAWEGREDHRETNEGRNERQKRWRDRVKHLSAQLRDAGITPPMNASMTELERLVATHVDNHVDADVDASLSTSASTVDDSETANKSKSKGEGELKNTRAKALSSPAKLPTCPTQSVIDLYHDILPNLPKVRLHTKDRVKAIRGIWTWVLTSTKADKTRRAETPEQALNWFRSYFARASENDFLMGRTPRSGEHAQWQCDIDFLMTDRGMKQVIEKTKDTP
jgi:hypothetical protein